MACCRWPSPPLALVAMCIVGLIFMLDRGVISSNGVGGSTASPTTETVVTKFNLTLFESGCIPAAYFVGLSFGSPIFGLLSSRFPVTKIIGAGFVIWGLSQLACGFSVNYAMLLCFRFLVGVGSGPMPLLPAVIDEVAPKKYVGLWLGILFGIIPLGYALGYIVGGAVGSSLSWRAAFWIQSGIAVPLAAFFLLARPIELASRRIHRLETRKSRLIQMQLEESLPEARDSLDDGLKSIPSIESPTKADGQAPTAENGSPVIEQTVTRDVENGTNGVDSALPEYNETFMSQIKGALGSFGKELKRVWAHPVAVCIILGMSFWNMYLNSAAWWGPKATLAVYYGDEPSNIAHTDFIFGGVAAGTGIFGTILGGVILDSWRGPTTLKKGLFMAFTLIVVAGALGVVLFGVLRNVTAYWCLLIVVELMLFAVQSPGYGAGLASMPPANRPFWLSLVEASQHLLGGIPGPPIAGAIQSASGDWHFTLAVMSIALAISGAFFLMAIIFARKRPDYSDEKDQAED